MPPQQQRPYQEIGLDQKQQQTLAMLHTDAVNNLPPAQHALKTAIKKLVLCTNMNSLDTGDLLHYSDRSRINMQ